MKKSELQEQLAQSRQRFRSSFPELKKWLDLESFVDCNLKEYDALYEELSAHKQQIDFSLKKSEELSEMEASLQKLKAQHREKFLRNLSIRQENNRKAGALKGSHLDELHSKAAEIDELSKQLSHQQDTHVRYRSLSDQRDFFGMYERLCRECEKLRNQNEQLQLSAGPTMQ